MLPDFIPTEILRRIDADAVRELQIPSLLLMENAARSVVDEVIRRGAWETITILAGPGNNGGDGLAVARLLAATGVTARVLLVTGGKSLTPDAGANQQMLVNSGLSPEELPLSEISAHLHLLSDRSLVIDALLGTGIRGTVASPFADVIRMINESSATVLAVDVPSGLDGNSGNPCGLAVEADLTVTFVAAKPGFRHPHARRFTGEFLTAHIGIPLQWVAAWYQRAVRPITPS